METQERKDAYDVLPVGVAIVDKSLRVSTWNAALAKWSGVAPQVAMGKTLDELLPGFNADRFKARTTAVFEDGQSAVLSAALREQVFPLRKTDGQPLFHKVHASAAAGGVGKALLVIEDVTTSVKQLNSLRAERRLLKESERSLRQQQQELTEANTALIEARSRAEKASRAKSEFVANMSHEVRTPLTAIKGFSEAMLANSDTPFVRDAAERVVRNADHLLSIVNDILDLSKIEAGKLRMVIEPCSPAALVEGTVNLLEVRAQARGNTVEVSIGEGADRMIASDPMRLRQVLVNLVDNAIKFTSCGLVRVGVERSIEPSGDESVRFEVTDTGVGIAPDKLGAIFQPFVQEDSSTQRKFGGTGLGLAITRQIVEQLGGQITADSDSNVGSTFVVTLPVSEPSRPTRVLQSREPSVANRSRPAKTGLLNGRRVLVAEDGPDNQRLIEYHLQRAGAEARIVEHGGLAVEAIGRPEAGLGFDAIVLDMQMPVMDGYTAASMLRSEGVALPIIALTASAMEGDREKALKAGCDEYLAKPLDADRFIGLLAQLIGEHAGQPRAQVGAI